MVKPRYNYCFYQCDCGKNYIVYVPMTLMYKEVLSIGEDLETVKLWDEQQRKSGEIERIKKAAELLRTEFRNVSINEIIQCDKCGRTLDVLLHLRQIAERKRGEK